MPISSNLFLIAAFLLAAVVIAFPRQSRNFFNMVFKRKEFVIVHQKKIGTDYRDVFLVVPENDFLTKVGKSVHNLKPDYAILKWRGRLHFLTTEDNVEPERLYKPDNKEVLFQVAEIKTALENNVAERLYAKKPEIILLILGLLVVIAIVINVYTIMTIRDISPLVEWLYANTNPGNMTIVFGE